MLKRVLTNEFVFNIMLLTNETVCKILKFVINKMLITRKGGIMKDLKQIKDLLIVVDMINGFVTTGILHDSHIQNIVPRIEDLVKKYVASDTSEVAFVRDAHSEISLELTKFPKHCLTGDYESELIDELKPYEALGRTYLKNSRSFMFAPNFINDLRQMRRLRQIIVTGCCTDLCVLDGVLPLVNYFDENNQKVEVIVDRNMVDTYDNPNHERNEFNGMALKLMLQEGVKIIGGNNHE